MLSRDVYDLSELIRHGAVPAELWVRHTSSGVLVNKRAVIMAKIDGINFALAAAELLPYIAPDIRGLVHRKAIQHARIASTASRERCEAMGVDITLLLLF